MFAWVLNKPLVINYSIPLLLPVNYETKFYYTQIVQHDRKSQKSEHVTK